ATPITHRYGLVAYRYVIQRGASVIMGRRPKIPVPPNLVDPQERARYLLLARLSRYRRNRTQKIEDLKREVVTLQNAIVDDTFRENPLNKNLTPEECSKLAELVLELILDPDNSPVGDKIHQAREILSGLLLRKISTNTTTDNA